MTRHPSPTLKLLLLVAVGTSCQICHSQETAIEQDLDRGIQEQRQDLSNGVEEERKDLDRGVQPSGPNGQSSDPREVSQTLRSLGYQLWYPVPAAPSNPPSNP
jgi:hypothetical protein